jgi:two-component system nitrate/nitrite response regulator NarL
LLAKPQRVRVYVADDHPVFRDGIAGAIARRPEFELVGSSCDGRDALREIGEQRPDVVVLDVRMPGLGGLEVLGALERDGVGARVLLLSAFTESEVVYAAVAAGAAGYLTKSSTRERICDAIAAVARGETVLADEVQAGIAGAIRVRERGARPVLSAREQEILTLIAGGDGTPAIGRTLHLSQSTVKTHMAHLYEKLGVSDRAAAVAVGMRLGLLE